MLQRLKLQRLKLQSLKDATKKRWFWRGITILVLVLIILLGTVTARLFVWPATGMPAKVWFNCCYPSGQYYSVGPKLPLDMVVPTGVIYESGATVKAEVFDRSC